MADELVGSARVRIEPDTTGFESALLSDLSGALDAAVDAISAAFRDASSQASTALGEIGAAGFDPTVAAADAAGASIEATFAGTAAQATTDLGQIGTGAGDQIGAAFDGVAADIETTLSGAATAGDAALAGIGEGAGAAIGAAFDGVAVDIESSLTGAAAAGDAALSGIGDGAGASITAEFDGVAGSIESSIAGAASDADASLQDIGAGVSIDIPVTIDTGEAESEVEGLTQGLGGLSEETEKVGSSTGEAATGIQAFGSAAEITGGNISGLVGLVGGLSPAAKTATTSIGAVATVIGTLTAAGAKSIESQTRFNTVFGQFGAAVESVNIGTLNGQLGDLAFSLGSSTSGLRDAATGIGQFGIAAGATQQEVAQTAEQVLALALRVRALNPALGDAGTIADGLTGALARGGRSAGNYGISLTAAEIATRAVELGLADAGGAITQFDKLMAGADLTAERLGSTLGADVAAGTENLSIRFDRLQSSFGRLASDLGKPLVVPVLEALEALLPLGLAVAEVVGTIAQAFIPLLEVIGALEPVLALFADAIGFLANTGLVQFAVGLKLVAVGFGLLTAAAVGVSPILAGVAGAIAVVAGAVTIYNSVFGDDGPSKQFVAGVKAAQAALADTSRTVSDSTEAFLDARVATGDLSDEFVSAAGGTEQLADALLNGGKSMDDVRDSLAAMGEKAEFVGNVVLADLQKQLDEAAKSQFALDIANGEVEASYLTVAEATGNYADELNRGRDAADTNAQSILDTALANGSLTVALRDELIAANTATDGTVNYTAALETLRATNLAAAEAQAAFTTDFAALASTLPTVAQAYVNLGDGIGGVGFDLADLAVQLAGSNVGLAEMTTIATGLGVPVEELQAFVEAANASIQEFVSTAVAQLPSVGTVFDAAAERAKEAERALSGADIVSALQTQLAALSEFRTNLTTIVAAGYDEMTAFALQGGPTVVAAIAGSLRDTDGAFAETFRTNFGAFGTELTAATAQVTALGPHAVAALGQIGVDATAAFGVPLSLVPGVAGAAVQGATDAVTAGTKGFVGAAVTAVTGSVDPFGKPLADGVSAGSRDAMTAAGNSLQSAASLTVIVQAVASGYAVGKAFSTGLAAGIGDFASIQKIKAAAAKAVNDAEAAARDAADSFSPSRLFARLGIDLSKGMAIGIEEAEREVVAAAEAIVRAAAAAASGGSMSLGSLTGVSGGVPSQFAALVGAAVSGGSGSSVVDVGGVSINVSVQTTGGVSEGDVVAIGNQVQVGVTQALVDRQALIDSRINRGGK